VQELLTPIRTESLKDVFISRFEELILSGQLQIGQKLPSERELALQLGVSRPVVHEGLLDLAGKGLVTMIPRRGTVVNDYRKEGSLSLLTTLFKYNRSRLDPQLLGSVLQMRLLLEVEASRLAAQNRRDEHLEQFGQIIEAESRLSRSDVAGWTEIDFEFHHLVTMATGNILFPLLFNSFKQFYTNLSGKFFSSPSARLEIPVFHQKLFDAIRVKEADQAMNIMRHMLIHGEKHLRRIVQHEGLK